MENDWFRNPRIRSEPAPDIRVQQGALDRRKAPPPPAPREWILQNSRALIKEYYRRTFDNALKLYRAVPLAVPFHRARAYIRLVVGSNQSGKTTSACAEIARIVLGKHPAYPKRDGIMLCVGLDEDHIGQNMWQKLSQTRSFQLVPDEVTGAPRAVRADPKDPRHLDPIDLARQDQWTWAPPFIPPEYAPEDNIVWENKKKNVPRVVKLTTGWTMLWHPSGGTPRRGIEIDCAWFDEEIRNSLWFIEVIPRLLRRNGSLIWSATNQTAGEELVKLHRRVEAGDPDVHETTLYLVDNPFISDEAKRRMKETYLAMSQEDYEVRYLGKWSVFANRVYDRWDMHELGVDGFKAA
jgi:hypothetical protein